MRSAKIFVNNTHAGRLLEKNSPLEYCFEYQSDYKGPPVSLTMPVEEKYFEFKDFPPFFDGLLPEGLQLEALLRQTKLDRTDYLGQLITIGKDPIGSVTICQEEFP